MMKTIQPILQLAVDILANKRINLAIGFFFWYNFELERRDHYDNRKSCII